MHEISKRSWHYRLYRYIGNVPNGPRYLNPFSKVEREEQTLPKSLCPYAWSILLGLIGVAFVVVALTIISPLLLLVFLAVVGWRLGSRFGVGVWRLAKRVARAIKRLLPQRAAKPKAKKPPRELVPSQPSLVASYLKARKQKACPPIKLVD